MSSARKVKQVKCKYCGVEFYQTLMKRIPVCPAYNCQFEKERERRLKQSEWNKVSKEKRQ